jgi:hypothetical protein
VAVIPEVLMLPLTDLSSFTVIVPLPEAEVVTGGFCSAPLSVTLLPVNTAFVESHAELIVSHPLSASAAETIAKGIAERNILDTFI